MMNGQPMMQQPIFGAQNNPNSAAAIYHQQQQQAAYNQYQQQQQQIAYQQQQEALRRQALAQQQQMYAQQQMNMMNQQMQNQNMMFPQQMQYNPYQNAQNQNYNMNLPQYGQPQQTSQTNSISSWGQGSTMSGKYRSKTEPSTSFQNQQPIHQQQAQQTQQPLDNETQKRIERLEDENLILKEKINMLTKALYKNQPYKFLIGNEESKRVTMENTVDSNGSVTHTLYGQDYDNSDIEITTVIPHVPKNKDGKSYVFFDPTDPEIGTEINNIVNIGETISEGIISNTIKTDTRETIYTHRVKVGQVMVIGGDDNLNKHAKDLIAESIGDDGELTDEIIREKSKQLAGEFNAYISSLKKAKSVKDVANFLCNTESEIRKTGKALKNYTIPLKLVEYLKDNFKSAYNEFARINLGLTFDPIGEFTAQAAIDADKGLKGEYPEFPRTQEEISKYSSSVESVIFNFLNGIKLLKLSLDINDDEVNVLIKTVVDMNVYSVILEDRDEVKDLSKNNDGTYIVSRESHRKIYSILESIMTFHHELSDACEDLFNKDTFIHNMVVRFSTIDNSMCVAYKAYKVIKGSRPIYVLKKIYQSL